jgi:hypothetical protein
LLKDLTNQKLDTDTCGRKEGRVRKPQEGGKVVQAVCRGGIHSQEMIEMKWSRASNPGVFAGNLWNS